MLRNIYRHIPNTITCCNLLSGCIAVTEAFSNNVRAAFLWILAGALFDFCDGMSARLLHAYSPIGKELDSLADLITFGLAPSVLCFKLLLGIDWGISCGLLPYSAFILAAASALRLAVFNTDTEQATSFRGLAVPANALFWCGLVFSIQGTSSLLAGLLTVAAIVIFSLLMVSRIPMFSLKFKNLSWKDNYIRYIFLIVSAPVVAVLGLKSTVIVILWYIILSVASSHNRQ